MSDGYRKVGEWSGYDKLQCDSCRFDSLSETTMRTHVEKAHPRSRPPKVKILGPTGEPVESIPVTDSPAETHEPLPAASSLGEPYDHEPEEVEEPAPRSFLDSLRDRKF